MSNRGYTGGGSPTLADFKQLALLGEGAYSAVYKVLRLADHEIYALKKVKLPSLSDKEKQNALNEIRLLASIEHENVIAYKEAFFDDKTRCLCIVQECADAGDLLQQINKCKADRAYLREADVWRYLIGMCNGLKALHDLRILHRDMKCANIFLAAKREGVIAKLGDFNVSKVAKRGLCMTQTGTPYYASPEVWRDMPYDAKSDMWSLGCVLYEMVALRPPFRAEDMEGLYRKVVRGQYPRIPAHYSQDLADVIAALLQVHPRHRPSVDQLLAMPALGRNNGGLAPSDRLMRPNDLLQTIKLPKNAIDLSGCLPKARYNIVSETSIQEERCEESDRVTEHLPQIPTRNTVDRADRRQSNRQGDASLSNASHGGLGSRDRDRDRDRDRERGDRGSVANYSVSGTQNYSGSGQQANYSNNYSGGGQDGAAQANNYSASNAGQQSYANAAAAAFEPQLPQPQPHHQPMGAGGGTPPVRPRGEAAVDSLDAYLNAHVPESIPEHQPHQPQGQRSVDQSVLSPERSQIYRGQEYSRAGGGEHDASLSIGSQQYQGGAQYGASRGQYGASNGNGPTINPQYSRQQQPGAPQLPQIKQPESQQSAQQPQPQARGTLGIGSSSVARSRPPMSIYARRQYAAPESVVGHQQQPPPSSQAAKPDDNSSNGGRRRRSLIPRLF